MSTFITLGQLVKLTKLDRVKLFETQTEFQFSLGIARMLEIKISPLLIFQLTAETGK